MSLLPRYQDGLSAKPQLTRPEAPPHPPVLSMHTLLGFAKIPSPQVVALTVEEGVEWAFVCEPSFSADVLIWKSSW